jgi:hypothetical protein
MISSSFQLLITVLLLHYNSEALLKKPTKATFKLAQKPFEQHRWTADLTEITDYPVNNVIFRITSSLLALSTFAVFSLPSEVFAAAGILVENGDICMNTCIYKFEDMINIHIYICICVYMRYISICIPIHIVTYIHMNMFTYVSVLIYVYTYIYIYIYICV